MNDLTEIDDVRRPFRWSEADKQKLNELNAEANKLQTSEKWTWAAKEGTDQYEYNHKRLLQYFVQHALETVVKHCKKCKSTGILVGLDQIDSKHCYDCMISDSQTRSEKKKYEKQSAWEAVRPKRTAYPKMVIQQNKGKSVRKDLPLLYPGDKAVIAPVHPVVTVRKNYFANKKLRQEHGWRNTVLR